MMRRHAMIEAVRRDGVVFERLDRRCLLSGADPGGGDPGGGDPVTLAQGSQLSLSIGDQMVVAGLNREGHLVVFRRDAPVPVRGISHFLNSWDFATLLTEPVEALATVELAGDGEGIIATTADRVLLYSFDFNDGWTGEVLTERSEERLVRGLSSYEGLDGRVGVVGVNAASDLVLLEQGADGWSFSNVSAAVVEAGGVRPRTDGDPTVYVARWGAVHITTAHADGLETVWRSSATDDRWQVTDMARLVPEASGLSDLSAFVTPWGGLHVAGVLSDGSVGVLWWTPQLEDGRWRFSDLTAETGGDRFRAGQLTTYVTGWGGLNIAGVDEGGALSAYWWTPRGGGWVSERVDVASGVGGRPETAPVFGLEGAFDGRLVPIDGLFSTRMQMVGVDSKGDLILFRWARSGSVWLFENVIATLRAEADCFGARQC